MRHFEGYFPMNFGKLFEKNSVRYQLFDACMMEATDMGRLPKEAEAVLKEMRKRFLNHNKESDIQRKERVQTHYMNLNMSKTEKHSAFKA